MEHLPLIIGTIEKWQNDFLAESTNFDIPIGHESLREKSQSVARTFFNDRMSTFINSHPSMGEKALVWLKNGRHLFIVNLGKALENTWEGRLVEVFVNSK